MMFKPKQSPIWALFLAFCLLASIVTISTAKPEDSDDSNNNNNKTRPRYAGLEFSLFQVHNTTTNEVVNFCILDFTVHNMSTKFNYRNLPLRSIANDFCQRSTNEISRENGYFLSDLSITTKCSVPTQIDNFAQRFPNATGLIFSTSCGQNLTTLKLTLDVLDKYSLVVSVINKDRANELAKYSSAQRIEVDDSIGTRSSFFCMVIIFSMAVSCVFIGALWGGRTRGAAFQEYLLKNSSTNILNQEDDSQEPSSDSKNKQGSELTGGSILFSVAFTICVILSLYFFYKYIVFFFIAIFMLFSAISFFECTSSLSQQILPSTILAHHYQTTVKYLGLIKIKQVNIPLLFLSLALPIVWFCIRHSSNNAWALQDLLCVCFCIFQLKILRLPSFRICFILLFALFVYDIFFVFITPLFTKSGISIMEYVATGGVSRRGTLYDSRCAGDKIEILPLSLRVPRNILGPNVAYPRDYCVPGAFSLLGLGDIIIPGVLVSYCAAFDYVFKNRRLPYFWTATIFYVIGLGFSYIALVTMEIAQPALLYLVPSTVFSVIILSLIRGEFRMLWRGPEKSYLAIHPEAMAHKTEQSDQ